ncbi:hypothetical protein ACSSS7_003736 [Eimeria intestinalis]
MGCIRTVYRRFREFANLNEEIKAIRNPRLPLCSRPELLGPLDRPYTGSPEEGGRSPHAATQAAADNTTPAGRAGDDALQQQQQWQEDEAREFCLQSPHRSVPWLLSVLRGKCGRGALTGSPGSMGGPPARLPPKTLLRSQRPDFVEQRRQQLEAYLRALLRREDVLHAWPLWGFLQGSPEARELARFFACSDPHRLRAPSRDLAKHLDDSLSALQRMGCTSTSSSSSSSSSSKRRGRLPWRLRHPAVGRRLLSLCASCCDMPLTTRARLMDLLLLLLHDSSSLEVLCSNEALDRALCMLENAYMLLSSICCPFTSGGPREAPPSGGPSDDPSLGSSAEGRGKFFEGDQREDGRQQQMAASPRGSSNSSSSSSSTGGVQQQDTAAGAERRLRGSFRDPEAAKPRGPPSPENACSHGVGRGGIGEEEGGGSVEQQGSFPLSRVALLLLLIDACTCFLCRLVEAEPLQLLEFCKTPDGFFRLNALLHHRTQQQQQQQLQQLQQQQQAKVADPASHCSRGEAPRSGGGGGGPRANGRSKGSHPSPGLSAFELGASSNEASLADGFAISDGSGAEEGEEEGLAAPRHQQQQQEQQGSGERQQEKLARRLVLLGAPFVCASPSSTFRKALHAAGAEAAAAAVSAGAVPAAAAAAARSSIGNGAYGFARASPQWPLAAGGPHLSHGDSAETLEELLEEALPPPALLAGACMQAADARLHVAVGLMLLNSIHLVEIQRVTTDP